jgi:hypothetical protein
VCSGGGIVPSYGGGGFGESQQIQFDIFHTKMLQNTSRYHITASI